LQFKILARCVHQTRWQYCELWGDVKSLELDLFNSSKKSAKDEDFIYDEYILTKMIPIIEYEKWEIYFKCEVISDFLYEILSEERKWYKRW
jgi:hypothetical protein